MEQTPHSSTSPAIRIWTDKNLLSICATSFLVSFMGSALNLALPKISEDLQMNAVMLTWMVTAFLVTTAIFQIPLAKIADIIGRKKTYFCGVALFSISTIGCGFASSSMMMILLRILSGIGAAIIFGNGMAILLSIFPPIYRARVIGINVATVYASLAAGPFLGGIITDALGWHWLFFISGIVGFIALAIAMVFLKGEWTEAKGEIFDVVGSVIFGIAIFAIIYGFMDIKHLHGIIWLAVGIGATIGFIIYEKRQIYPVLNIALFSGNRTFTLSTLAAIINYAATSGLSFMLSLYLQYIRGFEARHAGIILISQACIQCIFALLTGKLSERFSPSRLATTGMLIICVGLTGLIFLSNDTPIWIIVMLLLFFGIGFGIFSSPNTNIIMGSVSKHNYGQASATTGTARLIGQTFSIGIAGMIISLHLGEHSITPEVFPDLLASMKTTFIVFLILCLIGVYCSTARIDKNNTEVAE
ncbi:MAG: MFS transporter [Ignavibacteria bacterium]|jgi:EmrB/QacA subfamily drug resistance transporter|nr:MFS transporter [Ignavibacteria bacterium]